MTNKIKWALINARMNMQIIVLKVGLLIMFVNVKFSDAIYKMGVRLTEHTVRLNGHLNSNKEHTYSGVNNRIR